MVNVISKNFRLVGVFIARDIKIKAQIPNVMFSETVFICEHKLSYQAEATHLACFAFWKDTQSQNTMVAKEDIGAEWLGGGGNIESWKD